MTYVVIYLVNWLKLEKSCLKIHFHFLQFTKKAEKAIFLERNTNFFVNDTRCALKHFWAYSKLVGTPGSTYFCFVGIIERTINTSRSFRVWLCHLPGNGEFHAVKSQHDWGWWCHCPYQQWHQSLLLTIGKITPIFHPFFILELYFGMYGQLHTKGNYLTTNIYEFVVPHSDWKSIKISL